MRNLSEDLEECATAEQRRWVRRQRQAAGLPAAEGSIWMIDAESGRLDGAGVSESWTRDMYHSPTDALSTAECMASNAARRDGLGSWTLEVYGDGVNAPDRLRVRCHTDEEYFAALEAADSCRT